MWAAFLCRRGRRGYHKGGSTAAAITSKVLEAAKAAEAAAGKPGAAVTAARDVKAEAEQAAAEAAQAAAAAAKNAEVAAVGAAALEVKIQPSVQLNHTYGSFLVSGEAVVVRFFSFSVIIGNGFNIQFALEVVGLAGGDVLEG